MAESPTRWWEFYAVRYAMGTVVGSVAVLFLCAQRPEIQSLLPGITLGSPNAIDSARIALAAAYGLIYCYISSAPILVFHAGRFLLDPDMSKKALVRLAILSSILPALCTGVACCVASHHGIADKPLFCIAMYALVLLLELEVAFVYQCLANSSASFEFYQRLDRRRHSESQGSGEIVDSYKHLREHGNSFFIVFLEIGLGVLLFQSQKMVPPKPDWLLGAVWLAMLVIWIAPAVCVWLIATIFERRFSDS